MDNRPPSPDSPKIKKFCIELPPAFLEPKPQMELSHQTGFFSLDLFKVFKKTNISLQIPIPRRSQKVLSRPITTNDTPMSPIMAAASASAAAAAAHRHPGSHVAKSLLKSISGKRASLHEDEDYQEDVTFTAPQQTSRPLNKKQATAAVDQSMFLTKNAHIKRPRNAWIHVSREYSFLAICLVYNHFVFIVSLSLWTSTQVSRSYFTRRRDIQVRSSRLLCLYSTGINPLFFTLDALLVAGVNSLKMKKNHGMDWQNKKN